MTLHSTLTNPTDLHYAKIRTFTGNPALITPDFVDQLLSATDTNKVYRANSNAQGGLVELIASNGNGNGTGNSSLTTIGSGPPPGTPTDIGATYFDSFSNVFWCSIDLNGSIQWRSSTPELALIEQNYNISQLGGTSASVTWTWNYQNKTPSNDYQTTTMDSPILSSQGLEETFRSYGAGLYALNCEKTYDPNNEVASIAVGGIISFGINGFSGANDSYSFDKACFAVPCLLDGQLRPSFFVSDWARLKIFIKVDAYVDVTLVTP